MILLNGDDDSPDPPPNVSRSRMNMKQKGKVGNRHSTGDALVSDAAVAVTPKRASAPPRTGLKRPSGGTGVGSGQISGFAAATGAKATGAGAEQPGGSDIEFEKRTNRAATTIDLPASADPDGPPLPNFAVPDVPPMPDFLDGDPDGPELPSFGRSGGRSRGVGDGDMSDADPDGPELPDFGNFGMDEGGADGDVMDADDEQDMEDLAGAITRSRSSSFYNVGVDDEGGDGDEMSQEDFDKMMEEAGRSGG